VHHCDSWRIKDQHDVTCYFFHVLCAQHVSDINISIIRSLRLFCWIITLVVLFLARCVLEFRCSWVGVVTVLQASAWIILTILLNYQCGNSKKKSRKLLVMDILMSETCWAHKKWNKIASDIKLTFYSLTINLSCTDLFYPKWSSLCDMLGKVINLPEVGYLSAETCRRLHTTVSLNFCYVRILVQMNELSKKEFVLVISYKFEEWLK